VPYEARCEHFTSGNYQGPLAGWRTVETLDEPVDFFEMRTSFWRIGSNLDRNSFGLFGADIEHPKCTAQFIDDFADPLTGTPDIILGVAGKLLNLFVCRVIRIDV
jgi:hypothetical protein